MSRNFHLLLAALLSGACGPEAAGSKLPVAPEPRPPPEPPQLDPDGNDEQPLAAIALPERGKLVKVGRHWGSLSRICDFASVGDALYSAHATEPLGLGGATIVRWAEHSSPPFAVAFDWNRPGEPEKGGGAAGQGFLRIRSIEGRLWVPDADPPYLGFRITPGMAEGYVFVSDDSARFERPGAGHRPPKSAVVLPGALHVFDVIRFRQKRYASASAVVPASGKHASSPGTLFVEGAAGAPWNVAFTYPGGSQGARLGYLVRFRDRLYAALSPLDDSDHNDYVVIDPPRGSVEIAAEHARAVRVTSAGGAHTLRWYAAGGRLYWIAASASGVELRMTADGERWQTLELPSDAGQPADVLAVGARLLVLAERALLELGKAGFRVLARIDGEKTPFVVNDGYCAPPLTVHRGKLYAGGQRRGELYVLAGD